MAANTAGGEEEALALPLAGMKMDLVSIVVAVEFGVKTVEGSAGELPARGGEEGFFYGANAS